MIMFCPKEDDNHAPFPHRVVIPITEVVKIQRNDQGRRVRIVTRKPSEQEMVICASCDHWIRRPAGTCDCAYRCHKTSWSNR